MYYFTVNYSHYLLFYHDPSRLHLGNRAVHVDAQNFAFDSSRLHLENPPLQVVP